MVMMPTNKFPARYFLLVDGRYRDAYAEDQRNRELMVRETEKVARKLGAKGYRFIQTPQGGFVPGIFLFDPHRVNYNTWMPQGLPGAYVPNPDSNSGKNMLNLLAELPNCNFMKVLSVAGIDAVANVALPPNQVLEMHGQLYLVWYAPDEIPPPFGGAQELSKAEFDRIYVDHLGKISR